MTPQQVDLRRAGEIRALICAAQEGGNAEAAGPLYDCLTLNVRQSETLAAIRDVLLPKLLSGEIRVKTAETMVGDVA